MSAPPPLPSPSSLGFRPSKQHPTHAWHVVCMPAASETGMHHQYTRVGGHPPLSDALSAHYSPEYGRAIDAGTNVCVTTGAAGVALWPFKEITLVHSSTHASTPPPCLLLFDSLDFADDRCYASVTVVLSNFC